jgi:hypothetical protein
VGEALGYEVGEVDGGVYAEGGEFWAGVDSLGELWGGENSELFPGQISILFAFLIAKIKGSYIPHSAFEPRVSGDEMAEGFADGSSEIFRAAVASRFFV